MIATCLCVKIIVAIGGSVFLGMVARMTYLFFKHDDSIFY